MIFDNGIWGPYNFVQSVRSSGSKGASQKYTPTRSQKIKNKRRGKK